jgi:hypothetical protein
MFQGVKLRFHAKLPVLSDLPTTPETGFCKSLISKLHKVSSHGKTRGRARRVERRGSNAEYQSLLRPSTFGRRLSTEFPCESEWERRGIFGL